MKSDSRNLKKVIAIGIVVVTVMTVFAGTVSAQAPTNANTIPSGQQSLGAKTTDDNPPTTSYTWTGDNPPTTSYTWTGAGGIVVDITALKGVDNPAFTISGIPAGSTIIKAYMYAQEWEYSPGETASATLSGISLATVSPIANDSCDGLNLATYRWDVTSVVTDSGSYPFTTSRLEQSYGAALVVIYSNPSDSLKQVIINDGAEALEESTSTTTFSGIEDAGSGTLILFTEADNVDCGTSESISFNGEVILGPGDVFNANQGNYSSLFELPIHTVKDTNTASITTDVDRFGWHLAILVTEAKQPPVLLVHGFGSDPTTWNTMKKWLEDDGFKVETIELDPYGAFQDNARKLTKKIHGTDGKGGMLKEYNNTDKVDIVAHSMGGLVTRWYLELGDYKNDVRKLIMIGTPNWGSDAGWYFDWLNVMEPARSELRPNSPQLQILNERTPINPNVQYKVIAGTKIPTCKLVWMHFLGLDFFYPTWVSGDGVVTLESTSLESFGLSAPISKKNHIHTTAIQMIHPLCTPLLESYSVYENVKNILLTDTQQSSMSTTIQQAFEGDQETLTSIRTPQIFNDTIYQDESKSYSVLVDYGNIKADFQLSWREGDLNFTLTTPNSTIIDPSVATNDSSIDYIENNTYKEYIIQNPDCGNWTMNITATNVSGDGESYAAAAYLETNLILAISTDKNIFDPNEQINITACILDNGTVITSASVTAKMNKPDSTTENITLYDDGLHGDNQTNDGIYTNTYTNTSLWGTYDITVTASGILHGEDFQREAFTTVWVEQYPDLTLNASDISFSSETPTVGENITINAIIHNIGEANATNATILFYDGEPVNGTAIGEDIVNVSVNATANASVSWTAKAGVHEIYVLISPYNEFLEENYTNNQAFKSITVAIANLSFDTGTPANPYPSIFGTYNGTIKPNQTITVSKLYTYPCEGTGGHTEIAMIWNKTIGECAVAEWNGYIGDYLNISFNKTLTLEEGVIYNYTIRTGSYPQIHHTDNRSTSAGFITCSEFIDANGRRYDDWIPAIRLE